MTAPLWTELWEDTSSEGEVHLMVRALEGGSFELVDPATPGGPPERFATYAEAVESLVEDEYVRVGERVAPASSHAAE